MAKKNFQKPIKAKSSVIQYIIVGLICLPLLIWFSISAENKWHLSQALTIFIMCLIILAAWLIWIGIRALIHKRSAKIYKEKLEKRKQNRG